MLLPFGAITEQRFDARSARQESHPLAVPALVVPNGIDMAVVQESPLAEAMRFDMRHYGAFARAPILQSQLIMGLRDPIQGAMNDPLMDVTPLLNAHTADGMFEALLRSEDSYYREFNNGDDLKHVNVSLVEHKDELVFAARRDIESGEELTKAYLFGARW